MENEQDEWDWMGPEQSELFRQSEIARNLRAKGRLSLTDAVDLAIESARVLGRGYIYVRQSRQVERTGSEYHTTGEEIQKEIQNFTKVYVLAYYVHFDWRGDSVRVDGEENEGNIVGVFADISSQPSIEDLLKNESRVEVKLIRWGRDSYSHRFSGPPPKSVSVDETNKIYELTPKKD